MVTARAAVLAALDHAREARTPEARESLRLTRAAALRTMRSVPYGTDGRTDLARAMGQALAHLEACEVAS